MVVVAPGAVLPIRTVSEANRRDGWRARAARAKWQRSAAFLLARKALGRTPPSIGPGGVYVALARHAPRAMDDDNLRGALKAVRDGVADYLGVDDDDLRVRWGYQQVRSRAYAVEVSFHPLAASGPA